VCSLQLCCCWNPLQPSLLFFSVKQPGTTKPFLANLADHRISSSLETFAHSLVIAAGHSSFMSKQPFRTKSALRQDHKVSRRKSPPPVTILVNLTTAPPAPPPEPAPPRAPSPAPYRPPQEATATLARRPPSLTSNDLWHRIGTLARPPTCAAPPFQPPCLKLVESVCQCHQWGPDYWFPGSLFFFGTVRSCAAAPRFS
jgi:hypothetical protein